MLEFLKLIHIACAVITITGFIARGIGMVLSANWLQWKITRILPHVIDTFLLLSAIGMLSIYGFNMIVQGWLLAKIVGLLVYIFSGTIALKRGKTKSIKVSAFVVAIVTFSYIVSVAYFKSAYGFLLLI